MGFMIFLICFLFCEFFSFVLKDMLFKICGSSYLFHGGSLTVHVSSVPHKRSHSFQRLTLQHVPLHQPTNSSQPKTRPLIQPPPYNLRYSPISTLILMHQRNSMKVRIATFQVTILQTQILTNVCQNSPPTKNSGTKNIRSLKY